MFGLGLFSGNVDNHTLRSSIMSCCFDWLIKRPNRYIWDSARRWAQWVGKKDWQLVFDMSPFFFWKSYQFTSHLYLYKVQLWLLVGEGSCGFLLQLDQSNATQSIKQFDQFNVFLWLAHRSDALESQTKEVQKCVPSQKTTKVWSVHYEKKGQIYVLQHDHCAIQLLQCNGTHAMV